MKRILLILLLLIPIVLPLGAESVAKSPSAATNNSTVGSISWSNITNVYESDHSYTTTFVEWEEVSYYLLVQDFGFSIPTGASIDGITAKLECTVSEGVIEDSDIRLYHPGDSTFSDDKSNGMWDFGTDRTYGANNDLWGKTWSSANINSSDFGMGISVTVNFGDYDTALIDHIEITVYYSAASGWNREIMGVSSPASIMGIDVENIQSVMGVE